MLICGSRVDVEFGGFGGIVALESNFFIAATYVESLFVLHFVCFAIYSYHTVSTDIDYAQFAAFQKVGDFRSEFMELLQFQNLVYRHHSTVNQTVIQGIREVDFIRSHDFVHHESTAQAFGVVVFDILRMAGGLYFVVHLGVRRQCAEAEAKSQCKSFHFLSVFDYVMLDSNAWYASAS